jgi:hypothetical protein
VLLVEPPDSAQAIVVDPRDATESAGRFRSAAPAGRLCWALGGDASPERAHEVDDVLA